MKTTTTTSRRDPAHSAHATNQGNTSASALSVRQINTMRIGYLVMGVGLAVRKWPLLLNRTEPWPLMEGVATYMLVAMGLLALLGLRYPVKMLPILLFESAWKLLWLAAVALPLVIADQMDPATAEVAGTCLWVVIILAVIPWRYVLAQYLRIKGDPWRPRRHRLLSSAQNGSTEHRTHATPPGNPARPT